MIKIAKTQGPVIDVIKGRWSARSFAEKALTEQELHTMIEAASWAASANNEQPWEYYYALKGTPGFDKLAESLMPGNKPWASNAGALIVSVARKTFAANGNENKMAMHDAGMANAQLMLQARAMDIHTHAMGGFDRNMVAEQLQLGDDKQIVCMIAAGYLDHADKLEEPFKTREVTERSRKPVAEIARVI